MHNIWNKARRTKIKRYAFLLLVFAFEILSIYLTSIHASKIKPNFRFDVSKEVKPCVLHLGDEVEIIFFVRSEHDLKNVVIWNDQRVTGGYAISNLEPLGFAVRDTIIVKFKRDRGISRMLSFSIRKGDEKRFRLKAKINDVIPEDADANDAVFGIGIGMHSSTKEHGWGVGSEGLILYLLDPKRGLLGTLADKKRGLPIIYRYSADKRKVYPPGMFNMPVDVEKNKEIIAMMKELEPSLSDSEALQLHADFRFVGIPKGDTFSEEKEIYRYYLTEGWLDAMRTGKRPEWINKEKMKIAQAYAKQYEKRKWFFRNFPLILGSVCSIALIFLIFARIKQKRKHIFPKL